MEETGTANRDEASSFSGFIRRFLAAVAIITSVGLVLWLISVSIHVWLEVFAGILLAVFLRGSANWISSKTGLSSGWALAVTIVGLAAIFAFVGWLLAPSAVQQFKQLRDQLPDAVHQLKLKLQDNHWIQYFSDHFPFSSNSGIGGSGGGKAVSRIGAFFSGGFAALTGLILILFLGLYLAAAPGPYLRGLLHLIPMPKRPRVQEALAELSCTLRHWIVGQAISMSVVGILIGLGLKFLGVPLPVALGVLAGVFDFVPIIGPLFSAIPSILFAFLIGPLHALYVVILFVVVNTVIESHLLVPLIQRYTVSLPPALTILAMVLLGSLFGFLGVLLATPLAAAVLVLVRIFYVEDVLHDYSAKADSTGQDRPRDAQKTA
jgi:predicted PurR-regulated permease PerM